MRQSTIDRWSAVVAEFEASGLSAARFCEARQISAASFYMNRRKLREAARGGAPARVAAPAFVEAVVVEERDLVVECRGGRRVVVPRGFDEVTLARVIATLEHESLVAARSDGAHL